MAAACLFLGGTAWAGAQTDDPRALDTGTSHREAVSTGPDRSVDSPSGTGMSGRPNTDVDRPTTDRSARNTDPNDSQATAAAPTTMPSDARSARQDGLVSVQGRINKIDRADNTFEIGGVDRQLKVDSTTNVTHDGSRATLSDVREGEQVRASFDDGFPAHVRQVEILGGNSSTTGGAATGTGSASSPSDVTRGTAGPADDTTTTTTPAPGDLPRRDSPSESMPSPSPTTR